MNTTISSKLNQAGLAALLVFVLFTTGCKKDEADSTNIDGTTWKANYTRYGANIEDVFILNEGKFTEITTSVYIETTETHTNTQTGTYTYSDGNIKYNFYDDVTGKLFIVLGAKVSGNTMIFEIDDSVVYYRQ